MKSQRDSAIAWMFRALVTFLILASIGCQDQGVNSVGTAATSNTDSESSITLALLGDVMLGRGVHPTPETFAYLEPLLSSADLALANLESPLTDSPAVTDSPYALCAPPGNVQYLVDAGFDLLSISNNHHLDCGMQGLVETETTLTEAGLGFMGPELKPVYKSINGMHLAFLAFDATVTPFDIETAIQAVQTAHEAGAVVVVSIHWGVEYQTGATATQKAIADQLAEAGATLIWGHHPHVLQPADWLGNHNTLVFYSLGNALFDQYGLDSTRQSALILVTLNSAGVVNYSAHPFLIDVPDSQVVQAGETDIQRIMQYFK